jgi:hypothetical protein
MQGLVASADAGGVLVDPLLLVGVTVNVRVGVEVRVEVGGRVNVGVCVEVDGGTGDWHADTINANVIVILNNQIFFIFTSLVGGC